MAMMSVVVEEIGGERIILGFDGAAPLDPVATLNRMQGEWKRAKEPERTRIFTAMAQGRALPGFLVFGTRPGEINVPEAEYNRLFDLFIMLKPGEVLTLSGRVLGGAPR